MLNSTDQGKPLSSPISLSVTLAELKFIQRIRSLTEQSLVTVRVGGDGEPKEIVEIRPAQKEVLTK